LSLPEEDFSRHQVFSSPAFKDFVIFGPAVVAGLPENAASSLMQCAMGPNQAAQYEESVIACGIVERRLFTLGL
jgi:hypothetical protein